MGDPSWIHKEVNSEVPAGKFLRSVQLIRRSKLAPKELIPRCQWDIFAPAGQFLRSVNFLRRSELAPEELIPRCQRNIFAPTEF